MFVLDFLSPFLSLRLCKIRINVSLCLCLLAKCFPITGLASLFILFMAILVFCYSVFSRLFPFSPLFLGHNFIRIPSFQLILIALYTMIMRCFVFLFSFSVFFFYY